MLHSYESNSRESRVCSGDNRSNGARHYGDGLLKRSCCIDLQLHSHCIVDWLNRSVRSRLGWWPKEPCWLRTNPQTPQPYEVSTKYEACLFPVEPQTIPSAKPNTPSLPIPPTPTAQSHTQSSVGYGDGAFHGRNGTNRRTLHEGRMKWLWTRDVKRAFERGRGKQKCL